MIDIDGSKHSGSGTIVRYAMALATLLGEPLRVRNIRSNRPKPGLRHQHLAALLACARISGGHVEGAAMGSGEIVYHPGPFVKEGDYAFDVGSAGSTTLLSFALMIPALFASGPCRFEVTGGLFQDCAPSAYYMRHCLFTILERMGARLSLDVLRPGYVPHGRGLLAVLVHPVTESLNSLELRRQGTVKTVRGVSLASHLSEQRVAPRMAQTCVRLLKAQKLLADIHVVEEATAAQRGAVLTIWGETDTGALLGSTRAGARGRPSENIAKSVAESLLEDLSAGATVDRHLADQLVIFAALAKGTTTYRIPELTDHIRSNLWLVEKILGARTEVEADVLTVEGIGFSR
jgi:RNA 3'-terminal phosphate cyclase (ATP)